MVYFASNEPDAISVQLIVVNERRDSRRVDDLADIFRNQRWPAVVYRDVHAGVNYFRQALPPLVVIFAERPTKECFDLCSRLTRLGASHRIAVILYSSSSKSSYKTRAYSCGAVDYWVAPADAQDVIHRATIHLELQRAQAEIVHLQAELTGLSGTDIQERRPVLSDLGTISSQPTAANLNVDLPFSLEEIFAVLDEVVITISGKTQTVLLISPSAEKMFGFSMAELVGQQDLWKQIIHPEDSQRVDLALQTLTADHDSEELEYRFYRKDGTMRWVSACFHGIYENNELVRIHGLVTDITERKQTEEQLMRRALYDDLTEVPNRTLFIEQIEKALSQTIRASDYQFAILFIDLSRFKQINDTFGHLIGDKVLVSVAKILKNCIRPADMVSRFGGDEFTIFVDALEDESQAVQVAERVFEALASPVRIDGCRLYVGASIGIAIGNRSYRQVDDLLKDADTAMYRAKSRGAGNYDFFFELQTDSSTDQSLEPLKKVSEHRQASDDTSALTLVSQTV